MSLHSFGGFDPETIAVMSEVLDVAFEKLQDTGEPDVVREIIATRIIAAARLGERFDTQERRQTSQIRPRRACVG
jgi:hypothetical protein